MLVWVLVSRRLEIFLERLRVLVKLVGLQVLHHLLLTLEVYVGLNEVFLANDRLKNPVPNNVWLSPSSLNATVMFP